jgi:hypothetical protein
VACISLSVIELMNSLSLILLACDLCFLLLLITIILSFAPYNHIFLSFSSIPEMTSFTRQKSFALLLDKPDNALSDENSRFFVDERFSCF